MSPSNNTNPIEGAAQLATTTTASGDHGATSTATTTASSTNTTGVGGSPPPLSRANAALTTPSITSLNGRERISSFTEATIDLASEILCHPFLMGWLIATILNNHIARVRRDAVSIQIYRLLPFLGMLGASEEDVRMIKKENWR